MTIHSRPYQLTLLRRHNSVFFYAANHLSVCYTLYANLCFKNVRLPHYIYITLRISSSRTRWSEEMRVRCTLWQFCDSGGSFNFSSGVDKEI